MKNAMATTDRTKDGEMPTVSIATDTKAHARNASRNAYRTGQSTIFTKASNATTKLSHSTPYRFDQAAAFRIHARSSSSMVGDSIDDTNALIRLCGMGEGNV